MAILRYTFLIALLCLFTFLGTATANPVADVEKRNNEKPPSPKVELCTSEKCKDYAKYIEESMAPNYKTLDPCQDFDAYACDGWRNSHKWRKDQSSVSITVTLIEEIQALLRSILENPYADNTTFTGIDRDFDKKNFEKLKAGYDTCMNVKAIQASGIEPMRKMLDEFGKVFPAVRDNSSKISEKEELTRAMTWITEKNVNAMLGASPTSDEENPDVQMIALGSADVSMAKPYYLKSGALNNYTRMIAEMHHVLSTGKSLKDEPIPAAKNESLFARAKRISDFEAFIASKLAEPEVQNDVKYFYQPRTLSQIEELIPLISVQDILKDRIPNGYKLTSNTSIIVSDMEFFGNLTEILKKVDRETLHDYLEWRLYVTWAPRLSAGLNAPLRAFNNVMQGKEPEAVTERYRVCIKDVDSSLGHLLSGVFIQRKFTPKDKQIGDQVIQDIRKIFSDNMKNLDWMSSGAKETAAKKVANVNQKIGYQTKAPNDASPKDLHEYYQNLTVSTNFWENGFTTLQFNFDKLWKELLKPTDRNKWEMTASTVNAYYSPELNEIVFPAGIMQPPMFGGDLPDYVSYGSFGAIAGHELTHGFDDNGAKYDASGHLRDWWDNATTSNFEKKTQCFVKQYGDYFITGPDGEKVKLNGKLTLGENIADAGGLNAAFRAWKARETAAGKPNPSIPGLEHFTNEQLFFISYGNSWCENTRANTLMTQVFSDPHSPAKDRVIGTTANSADFRKAFNCPVKKANCDLWF